MAKPDPKLVYDIAVGIRIPKFKEAVDAAVADGKAILVWHQDAFAADYQEDELYLLGVAVKYAGENGIELHIIGKNRETLPTNL